uniref:Tetratricopeptide repeat protein n=1 Tax=Trepomonas sp. PC1 TaxID=1076344 RepID=A0A146KAT8_9EUKA|eukprot:JAP92835.1 Tetratricopeptide repeat protein [Trepomonas sp. PC1]
MYQTGCYEQAIIKYTQILESLEQYQQSQLMATIFYNMSLTYKNMKNLDMQEQSLIKCLKIDSLYRKARIQLAKLYMDQQEFISAQLEWQNIQQLSELSKDEKELKEICDKKSIDETLTTLKGWGNKILGKFGMSLDQFQVQKNEDGSMNIGMKK